MSVNVEKPKIHRNWKAIGEHLGQAAIAATRMDGFGTIDSIRKALGPDSLHDQTVDERAWTWLSVSLASSLARALEDDRLRPMLDANNLAAATTGFLEQAIPLDGTEALDHAALVNPASAPALQHALGTFPALIDRIATGHTLTEAQCRALLETALRLEAPRVYALDSAAYKPIIDGLTGPIAEGARREFAWSRHADWIRGLWERKPIFGQEPDSGLSLSRVYLPLRCFWHEELETDEPKRDRHAPKKLTAHVNWLHETMHDWLIAEGDRLRLVTGGPGSGKSSFARAFATEVIDGDTHRVIFVPLQHITLGGELKDRLGSELFKRWDMMEEDGGKGFPENPLDWLGTEARPVLLIFDGLDELTPSEEKAEELTRKFVASVNTLIRTMPRVKAVILGRPAACQQAMKAADFELSKDVLLHVAPMTPLSEWTVGSDEAGNTVETISDPGDLMKDDQREDFWRCWAALQGEDTELIPPAITDEAMGELNAEPLLLYLLLWTGYAGEKWQDAIGNRNVVYRRIFARVFARNKVREDFTTANIEEEDFFDLMECLGLAAWRGNGRTGTDTEFATLRDRHLPHKRDKFAPLPAASLGGAAVNFYTRLDFGDAPGFEFIHKSFGEYLVARGLLSAAKRAADWLHDPRRPGTPEQVAEDWVALIEDAELTEQIIQFAIDEARLLHADDPDGVMDAKIALVDLFSWTLENGMPAHRASALSFRQVETRQRCAETALLLTINALARSLPIDEDGGHLVDPMWPEDAGPFDTLERLHATRGRIARNLLGILSAREAYLRGADLFEANLRGANLRGADLFEANLSGANLRGADLRGANLRGANLFRANLIGANLSGADLIEANLIEANLRGANLSGADLFRADLFGADLYGADLSGADLFRANLSGADLREAHLVLADCNRLRLDSARLQSASLEGAKSLTQKQIDSAFGNAETELPEGLTMPPHWLEDDSDERP